MVNFFFKRITDPVHGTIGLSELEEKVVDTPVFQRLRNVKHLGLAHLVFPGGDFSRFTHSLGVCHITGRILETLRSRHGASITEDEIQLYRLAALLHDIGHYPFSHPMDEAISNHYSSKLLEDKSGGEEKKDAKYYKHEQVTEKILKHSPDLQDVLPAKLPAEIASIITRENPALIYRNIISSDLDADRIEYLLRTSHTTGLPYGAVDFKYILTQIRSDQDRQICLSDKALRTAEHLLLSRYFTYQQVVYHKTVVAFELLLKDVIENLLKEGKLDCSASWITNAIENGNWHEFDDSYMLQIFRDLCRNSTEAHYKLKSESILERKPPKLVFTDELIGKIESPELFKQKVKLIKEKIDGWTKKFGIDKSLWYLWSKSPTLTKIGSHVPSSAIVTSTAEDKDKYEQAVRIQSDEPPNSSIAITDKKNSLMHILGDYALYSIRIYVLFSDDTEEKEKKGKIIDFLKKDLST